MDNWKLIVKPLPNPFLSFARLPVAFPRKGGSHSGTGSFHSGTGSARRVCLSPQLTKGWQICCVARGLTCPGYAVSPLRGLYILGDIISHGGWHPRLCSVALRADHVSVHLHFHLNVCKNFVINKIRKINFHLIPTTSPLDLHWYPCSFIRLVVVEIRWELGGDLVEMISG